jgi:hypothetical protein
VRRQAAIVEQNEFVAAPPPDYVRRAAGRPQLGAKLPQQFIAGQVPVAVVHLLKAIDIDKSRAKESLIPIGKIWRFLHSQRALTDAARISRSPSETWMPVRLVTFEGFCCKLCVLLEKLAVKLPKSAQALLRDSTKAL